MFIETREESIERLRNEFKESLEENTENVKLKTTTINERMAVYVSINLIRIALKELELPRISSEVGIPVRSLRKIANDPKDALTASESNIVKLSKSILNGFRKFIPEDDVEELKCISYPGYRNRQEAFESGDIDELKKLGHHNIMDWYTEKNVPCIALACEMLSTGFFAKTLKDLRYGDVILQLAKDAVDSYLAFYDKEKDSYKFYSDTFERKNPRFKADLDNDLVTNFISVEGRGEDIYLDTTNTFHIPNRHLYEVNKLTTKFKSYIFGKFAVPYLDNSVDEENSSLVFMKFTQGVIGKAVKKHDYEDRVEVGKINVTKSKEKKSA